jgi:hypothetical protein
LKFTDHCATPNNTTYWIQHDYFHVCKTTKQQQTTTQQTTNNNATKEATNNNAKTTLTQSLHKAMRPTSAASSRSIFYQLFRPEFVQSFGKPLSSDGYSRFGSIDAKLHNATLDEATETLYR